MQFVAVRESRMQFDVVESPPLNPSEEPEEPPEELPEIENVLAEPDVTTDVILEVEGRELHANRAVLAHYSPFFHSMFYSNFKEKSTKRVPLPGKTYDTMVTFFNLLYPRSVSAECLINDGNIIQLLALAEEYQTDHVKLLCQQYVREQVCAYFYNFYRHSVKTTYRGRPMQQFCGLYDPTVEHLPPAEMAGQPLKKEALIEKLTLYLWACDAYQLLSHRNVIKSLFVEVAACLNDVTQCQHYKFLPLASRVDLLEALCRKFEVRRNY